MGATNKEVKQVLVKTIAIGEHLRKIQEYIVKANRNNQDANLEKSRYLLRAYSQLDNLLERIDDGSVRIEWKYPH